MKTKFLGLIFSTIFLSSLTTSALAARISYTFNAVFAGTGPLGNQSFPGLFPIDDTLGLEVSDSINFDSLNGGLVSLMITINDKTLNQNDDNRLPIFPTVRFNTSGIEPQNFIGFNYFVENDDFTLDLNDLTAMYYTSTSETSFGSIQDVRLKVPPIPEPSNILGLLSFCLLKVRVQGISRRD